MKERNTKSPVITLTMGMKTISVGDEPQKKKKKSKNKGKGTGNISHNLEQADSTLGSPIKHGNNLWCMRRTTRTITC